MSDHSHTDDARQLRRLEGRRQHEQRFIGELRALLDGPAHGRTWKRIHHMLQRVGWDIDELVEARIHFLQHRLSHWPDHLRRLRTAEQRALLAERPDQAHDDPDDHLQRLKIATLARCLRYERRRQETPWRQLLGQPELERISRIELIAQRLDEEACDAFERASMRDQLRYLRIARSYVEGGDELVDRLTHVLSRFGALRELYLDRNAFGNAIGHAASRRGLPHVERLGLSGNRLDAEGLDPLLAELASHQQLRALYLTHNQLEDGSLVLLARHEGLGRLERLRLHNNPFGDAGLGALARSPHLARLQELSLGFGQYGVEGLAALACHAPLPALDTLSLHVDHHALAGLTTIGQQARWLPQLRHLKVLDLEHPAPYQYAGSYNPSYRRRQGDAAPVPDRRAADSFAARADLSHLEVLEFTAWHPDQYDARFLGLLLRNPSLVRLERLSLAHPITEAQACQAFDLEPEHLPALRRLELRELDNDVAPELMNSALIDRIETLELGHVASHQATVEALVARAPRALRRLIVHAGGGHPVVSFAYTHLTPEATAALLGSELIWQLDELQLRSNLSKGYAREYIAHAEPERAEHLRRILGLAAT